MNDKRAMLRHFLATIARPREHLKRLLIHAGGCNLALVMCTTCGVGTLRSLAGPRGASSLRSGIS
jgi:hypothetical protein